MTDTLGIIVVPLDAIDHPDLRLPHDTSIVSVTLGDGEYADKMLFKIRQPILPRRHTNAPPPITRPIWVGNVFRGWDDLETSAKLKGQG